MVISFIQNIICNKISHTSIFKHCAETAAGLPTGREHEIHVAFFGNGHG